MALFKCEECKKEISDKAHVCPFCGNPTKTTSPNLIGKVEIEKTNKKWKKMGCIGFLLMLGSVFVFFVSIPLGILVSLIAMFLLIRSLFGAWWNNG